MLLQVPLTLFSVWALASPLSFDRAVIIVTVTSDSVEVRPPLRLVVMPVNPPAVPDCQCASEPGGPGGDPCRAGPGQPSRS